MGKVPELIICPVSWIVNPIYYPILYFYNNDLLFGYLDVFNHL